MSESTGSKLTVEFEQTTPKTYGTLSTSRRLVAESTPLVSSIRSSFCRISSDPRVIARVSFLALIKLK